MPEVDVPASHRPDPWSQLWGQTVRSSWDLSGENPVARALREHWEVQSGWISDCSHVVDIGSGPAVLARLVQASHSLWPGKANLMQWTCVDQARIPASAVRDLPFVNGRFGLPWEALPVPEMGAEGLVSNFGLEYISRDHLVKACASWLAEGGRLHAVMHARDSMIDRQSALGLADLDLILDELDFPGHAAAVLEAKVTAPADPMARMMHGIEARDAFNDCVNQMKARLEERQAREGALLEWLILSHDLVKTVSEATLSTALERLKTEGAAYRAERSRLTAMRACALDQAALEAVGRDLASHGFESIQMGSLQVSAGTVAWVLDARRTKGSH